MRELKPRAWSKSHSAYCDFATLDKTGAWIGWFERCGVYLADRDIVLELPTGLKDKNGKEIYEGDIVSDGYGKVIVQYSTEDVWSCGCCNEKFFGAGFIVTDGPDVDNFEVIGNIHENPELIKEEE